MRACFLGEGSAQHNIRMRMEALPHADIEAVVFVLQARSRRCVISGSQSHGVHCRFVHTGQEPTVVVQPS
ncbi:hypothetical protein NY99_09130 [Xanthomonas phaseoli pv. phaseoli]|uniref:Uncharacterized protein n=4 Tax=Xanthomonas TaxID=338 RepID=A0A1T1P8N5_9XANT|nr:Hypothetical Protein XCAW_01389 [Xanthomonas citri subsp. citri Aw12879]AKM25788.1 hypothetical protein AB890_14110 [Xanthomonas citri pv. citri]AOL19149.1 hypothetical protein BGK55_07850 [Xanthomonas citri pv. malvacearum]ARV23860.1 hypothetical protein A9D66_14965 [Xanthomonas citri pv. glycines str. 12-2]KGU56102.1 hypothetical protein NY99_09130 [Xanthomonas phaseoli pv. phaseoli]OEY90303.1 hypothetical protein BIY41_14955 [Xanthomonas citri pv. glycines]OOW58800.1 hypothetical protei